MGGHGRPFYCRMEAKRSLPQAFPFLNDVGRDLRSALGPNRTGSQTDTNAMAPAGTALAEAASGSSTIITIRIELPPTVSGLKLKCPGDLSATQNSAVSTDSRATTAPVSLSRRNNSAAPNAVLSNSTASGSATVVPAARRRRDSRRGRRHYQYLTDHAFERRTRRGV